MKTLRLHFHRRCSALLLTIALFFPLALLSQTQSPSDCKGKKEVASQLASMEKAPLRIMPIPMGAVLQMARLTNREALELEFNKMVEEIDQLYHTPPALQKPEKEKGASGAAKTGGNEA